MPRRLRPASLYPHARGSVIVPLAVHGLPERLQALGQAWRLKDEFHLTAASTRFLAERAGVTVDEAWVQLAAALEGRRVGPVRVRDELRLAAVADERTVIVMAGCDGLADLHAELAARLGIPLWTAPGHITLYTRPQGEAVPIHDGAQLHARTRAPTPAEDAELREAMGFAAVFGP